MKKFNVNKFAKTILAISAGISLVIILWRNQDALRAFIDFARDREAITAFLDKIGLIGPLILMGLVALQILIPMLPSEPPMIAGAFAYGFFNGFLLNWLVATAATQLVFFLARRAGRPLAERFVPAKQLEKWARIAHEKGIVFFLLAFIIPPVPSDMMIYVAGLSGIGGWHFFIANLIGRIPLIILYTLIGAYGFSITLELIIGLVVFGVLMLVVWWYFIIREQPDTVSRRNLLTTD